jgi:hypothetical protein
MVNTAFAVGGCIVTLIAKDFVWPHIRKRWDFATDNRLPLHAPLTDDAVYLLLSIGQKSVPVVTLTGKGYISVGQGFLGFFEFSGAIGIYTETYPAIDKKLGGRMRKAFDELKHLNYLNHDGHSRRDGELYRLNPNGVKRYEHARRQLRKRALRERIRNIEQECNASYGEYSNRANDYFDSLRRRVARGEQP